MAVWPLVLGAFVVTQLRMPRLDPKRPLAIFSPEWTSLDIPERLWMVGRVGIEVSTPRSPSADASAGGSGLGGFNQPLGLD